MNKLYNRFDRFCYRHSNKGIPNLMMFVSAGIAIVYLFSFIDPSGAIYRFMCYNRASILSGQVWRLVTYIFIPDTNGLLFLAIQLYFYYIIGRILERDWGTLRFNIFYFTGVLMTSVAALVLNAYATAFYINFSLFMAYASLYPENRVLLFFIIPLKIKYLAIAYLVLTIFGIIGGTFPSNLLPLFALLNYIIFFWPQMKNMVNSSKRRYSKESVNFRRQMNDIRNQNSKAGPNWAEGAKVYSGGGQKPYRHKCHVCGKTDAEYPDLDFRYCSKCNGYYCYCPDHIHNHIHVE